MKATFRERLSSAVSRRRSLLIAILGLLTASLFVTRSFPSGPQTHVEATFNLAKPRAVEELTQHRVTRDYSTAWDDLAVALSSNAPELLNAYFVGPAKTGLASAIASQKRAGIRSYYLEPAHKLEAIFYSPEGDVMELHDTVEFNLRLTADGELIHDEHIILHYVVLMTPAADRWVIRQLQAVSQF
jgi:hypothetical protein